MALRYVNPLGVTGTLLSVLAPVARQCPGEKFGGLGRPSRVVDLVERGDHAGVSISPQTLSMKSYMSV